jgi:hypothetical protein
MNRALRRALRLGIPSVPSSHGLDGFGVAGRCASNPRLGPPASPRGLANFSDNWQTFGLRADFCLFLLFFQLYAGFLLIVYCILAYVGQSCKISAINSLSHTSAPLRWWGGLANTSHSHSLGQLCPLPRVSPPPLLPPAAPAAVPAGVTPLAAGVATVTVTTALDRLLLLHS